LNTIRTDNNLIPTGPSAAAPAAPLPTVQEATLGAQALLSGSEIQAHQQYYAVLGASSGEISNVSSWLPPVPGDGLPPQFMQGMQVLCATSPREGDNDEASAVRQQYREAWSALQDDVRSAEELARQLGPGTHPYGPNETVDIQQNGKELTVTIRRQNQSSKTIQWQEHDKNGKLVKTCASIEVGADGTLTFTNADQSQTEDFTDGAALSYDQDGNVSRYQYADGSAVQYSYTNGLVTEVQDRDGTIWKRGGDGLFHQFNQAGQPTGFIEPPSHFIPPTTETNLYGVDPSGLGKLFGALGPDPDDIEQGDLGDCYFLSSVAALAKDDPQAIRNMIRDNHDGTFTVTFPGDPSHPVTVEGPTDEELKRFAHDKDGVWVAVLEKAHRYYTERVAADPGGDPSQALELLTGKKFDTESVAASNGSVSDAQVATMLTKSMQSGQEVVAWSPPNPKNGPPATKVVPSHAYTVLNYDAATQTVTLRNPWGTLGFDGKKIPSLHDEGGGVFTVSLDDFRKNFCNMSIEAPSAAGQG
jgi:hypothetical protein